MAKIKRRLIFGILIVLALSAPYGVWSYSSAAITSSAISNIVNPNDALIAVSQGGSGVVTVTNNMSEEIKVNVGSTGVDISENKLNIPRGESIGVTFSVRVPEGDDYTVIPVTTTFNCSWYGGSAVITSSVTPKVIEIPTLRNQAKSSNSEIPSSVETTESPKDVDGNPVSKQQSTPEGMGEGISPSGEHKINPDESNLNQINPTKANLIDESQGAHDEILQLEPSITSMQTSSEQQGVLETQILNTSTVSGQGSSGAPAQQP